MNNNHKFSEELKSIAKYENPTLQNIIDHTSGKGVFLATFLISIPFLQPFPTFGLSTAFGLVIFFNNLSILFSGKQWIPKFLGKKHVPHKILLMLDSAILKIFFYIEKFSKPRGKLFVKHPAIMRISAFFICIDAILLALPLPIPASNMVPAFPMFLIAVGTLEEDSYATLIGYFLSLLCILFFISVPFLFFDLLAKSEHFMMIWNYILKILSFLN